jgi:hypothetical protein
MAVRPQVLILCGGMTSSTDELSPDSAETGTHPRAGLPSR